MEEKVENGREWKKMKKMLIEWKRIFLINARIIYGCAQLTQRPRSGHNRHLYPSGVRRVVV